MSKAVSGIRRAIKTGLTRCKSPLQSAVQVECNVAAWWAAQAHKRLMKVQWGFLPQPNYFDNRNNIYFQWLETRNPMWLERGLFGGLALKPGSTLELSCGDGFNTRNFYSLKSTHVVSCDFDVSAIRTAQTKNSAPNIKYVHCDMREGLPPGSFDNVVWDGAIDHFSMDEIQRILKAIQECLLDNGVFVGSTTANRPVITEGYSPYKNEFQNKEQLLNLLEPYFENVTVFETVYPDRHTLYWWASDSTLPFQTGWEHMTTKWRNADEH